MSSDDTGGPRRLLLITNQYPLPTGDAVFVASELEALLAEFDEVHVLNYSSRSTRPSPVPPGVTYVGNAFGAPRRQKLRALLSFRRLARTARAVRWRQGLPALLLDLKACAVGMTVAADPRVRELISRPDGSVTVYAYWAMGAGLAGPWLRPDISAFVVRAHRYDLYEPPGPGLPIRRALYASADAVLAISDDAARYLRSSQPQIEPGRIHVARLGTLGEGRAPAPEPTGPLVVVSCSSIISVKRVGLILDALAHLARAGTPVRWIHFGEGPLMPELSAAARGAPETLAIELRGQADHASIMEFYRTEPVHLFVNASTSEGVPVSIMEAMSFDIPVVATDVGGTGEIVGEELGSGRLVGADTTPEELAAAIADVAGRRSSFSPHAVWERLSDGTENARRTARLIASAGSPA